MTNPEEHQLPEPTFYFPPSRGVYEVAPGLSKFGKGRRGGEADGKVFQIDREYEKYVSEKRAARRESPEKYYRRHRLDPVVETRVVEFIQARLVREWPEWFERSGGTLTCGLSGERIDVEKSDEGSPAYADAFEALAAQVQEDLAVVSTDEAGHWTSAIHLCFPNHWTAADKIGKSFAAVHEPVAGMEGMNDKAEEMVRLMINAREGLVRFAWGITWDAQLNHHPERINGSAFDSKNPAAFLRVERQTIWGFRDIGASLFTIRTYLYDCADLSVEHRRLLAAAIGSMNEASLRYKGLADSKDALIQWLVS